MPTEIDYPYAEFGKRLKTASDSSPHVPEHNYGRLRWFAENLQSRFQIKRTEECVRKWFYGKTFPRKNSINALAELLQVDVSWLSDGSTPTLDLRERKLRNAEADGAVNVVAGFIQMSGANPAFPDPDDQEAKKSDIDLYAIIRGAQYAFHVAVAAEVDGGFRISVPLAARDLFIIGLIRREGFAVDLIELDADGLAEHGNRGSGSIDVRVDPNYRTGSHVWKRIESFAQRL